MIQVIPKAATTAPMKTQKTDDLGTKLDSSKTEVVSELEARESILERANYDVLLTVLKV